MFNDMELIGIPHRLVVGERGLDAGQLEYRARTAAENEELPLAGRSGGNPASAWGAERPSQSRRRPVVIMCTSRCGNGMLMPASPEAL